MRVFGNDCGRTRIYYPTTHFKRLEARPIDSNDVKWLLAEQIPHLRRYARALTGDAHRADDLVQDTLERALKKRRSLRERSSVRAWAFKILYREFLARRRRKNYIADAEIDENAVSQAAGQVERLHCRDVLDALGNLPDEQRAAVTLVALEDVAYDDAAQMLDIPVGTLRSRLSRGRAALRRAVASEVGARGAADGAEDTPPSAHPFLRRVK